jgi:hypothetical protein
MYRQTRLAENGATSSAANNAIALYDYKLRKDKYAICNNIHIYPESAEPLWELHELNSANALIR